MNISLKIANELSVYETQVDAVIRLLDEGATVPFIARYRKEVTGGLDDIQLRFLDERLIYLRELEERKQTILDSISSQNKLTDSLKDQIEQAETKAAVEDLYLPYKPKRRTKAQIAKEAGLEPLALALLENPLLVPDTEAERYINTEHKIDTVQDALDGARQILMEKFSEDAVLLSELREHLWENGVLKSSVMSDKEKEAEKFKDYFSYREKLKLIPSHRALALFRGRSEGYLMLDLILDDDSNNCAVCESRIAAKFNIRDLGRAADSWLQQVVKWSWKIKLFTHLDVELKMRLRESAESDAIKVFANNLNDLLLAAPAGHKAIMGLDPGFRTGVKVAVIDTTGKCIDTATIYPHAPQNQWDESLYSLQLLCEKYQINLISIGNGTASRETERLAKELVKQCKTIKPEYLVVSEAGASVYSASELASQEFPDMDVSLRGAVSIARRLQDPLAELVKIDPKSIGVGQYQHDVNQSQLARSLDNTVEDCVNAVGVDVNTASPALLRRVAGLSTTVAENIVSYRDNNGLFENRSDLKEVPRLGDKTYEQAAGFLRISNGQNPLDASAVHPEAYPVVNAILQQHDKKIAEVINDVSFIRQLNPADYTDEKFGEPTIRDILAELEKPGRDPRPEFKTVSFKEGVETIADLEEGMLLEGVVSNVTNFGAFVDIGVHQDGLVHISVIADKFVKDPRQVVKAGQLVKVKVVSVDAERKRIALTMRLNEDSKNVDKPKAKKRSSENENRNKRPAEKTHKNKRSPDKANKNKRTKKPSRPPVNNAMAAAFALAKKK